MSSPLSLSFDASTARACANVPITDNRVTEPPEEFCVVLTTEGGDPEDPSAPKTTVTIIDDDRVTIGFEQEMYSAREDQGSQEVCALIINGELARDVVLSLLTGDGSAEEPDDYTAISTLITFNPSRSRECVIINIVENDILESEEDFEVTLIPMDNEDFVTLSPDVAIVTISDNDGESALLIC